MNIPILYQYIYLHIHSIFILKYGKSWNPSHINAEIICSCPALKILVGELFMSLSKFAHIVFSNVISCYTPQKSYPEVIFEILFVLHNCVYNFHNVNWIPCTTAPSPIVTITPVSEQYSWDKYTIELQCVVPVMDWYHVIPKWQYRLALVQS